MGKPVERQNHSLSFFILATLIAICTAWAFYEEFLGRRPWKARQEEIFSYDREKAQQDLRYFERRLDSGDLKVTVDPAKPDSVTTVAQAKTRLEALDKGLASQRGELDALEKEIKEATIKASDADLAVKYLKSEDDGLFYTFQHAQHGEALKSAQAAKLNADGKTAEAGAALAEAAADSKHAEETRKERADKAAEIQKAIVALDQADKALQTLKTKRTAIRGERDRLVAAIALAEDPVTSSKTALQNVLKKGTELTQYWLTSYDNSVDRCQTCHASVDKCGYSRPHEVLEALNAPNAKPEDVVTNYCLNPDTLDHYKEVAADVCAVEFDEAASRTGKSEGGRCFDSEDRTKIADFISNYCGGTVKALELLEDRGLKTACVNAENYGKLSPYVEDAEKKGACALDLKQDGETCVEGAKKDALRTWLSRSCPETSSTLAALAKPGKTCGSGEAGKKLSALKPVLYNYPVWAQTHPYRTDMLGSHHPAEKFGCTSCHEGQGAQTKGVAGNDFHHGYDDHDWPKPMLDLVVHKHYRPTSFSPPPTSTEGVPGQWVTHEKYFVESTCAKCHTEEVHLRYADTYSQGRRLVAEIGCHGCHPIDTFREFPRIGPTLTDLKKKTTPQFLLNWIAYPKSFRPRTKMPNFWPEALDTQLHVRAGTPELAKREDEVRKIAAYLWKNSEDSTLSPPPVSGNADHGKILVQSVGCRGCHNFTPVDKLCTPEQIAQSKTRGTPQEPGECEAPRSLTSSNARDFAPNLSAIGLKTNERWLYAWVKNPTAMWAQTRMPNLRLSDQEAADITAYLMTLKDGKLEEHAFFDEKSPEFETAAVEGGKLISKYGCAGCHLVKGHEDDPKIGTDMNEYGRKTTDLLDFGNAIPNPRHHTWYNFVDLKIRAPRVFGYERVETRMPQFDLNDDEVAALLTFLKSRTGDKVPASYQITRDERHVSAAQGDQLMEYFNCKGCHVIDGDGGRIRDIYAEDDLAKAPPILQQEGWRVQPDWMFGFLHDPSNRLRPWLEVRMPTFPLGDDRATKLVKAFSANANVPYPYITVDKPEVTEAQHHEAQAMVEELHCFSCHTAGDPKPDQDRSSLAPNLQKAKRRLRPDWVFAWIKNPQSLQDGTKMPSFFNPDAMETVMYPKYFGGSQETQIKALRDYVMSLPDENAAPAGKPQAALVKSKNKAPSN